MLKGKVNHVVVRVLASAKHRLHLLANADDRKQLAFNVDFFAQRFLAGEKRLRRVMADDDTEA